MRGFTSRARVEDATAWIDSQAHTGPSVVIAIEHAAGRVLAEDVVSPIDVPAFDRSAMDGYAVRSDETTGAGIYNPLTFRIVGQSLAGRGYEGAVNAGEAVRIMTGAPLPPGADAVIPVEYATEADGKVEITASTSTDKHIGRIGEDITCGKVVLSRGRRLRPQDVGVLASLGLAEVLVVRAPNVRLIVTGGELAIPGEPRRPQQIYEANSYLLRGLIARDGGVLDSIERLPDDRDQLRAALTREGADVVLVSGGTSVGSEDHAPVLVTESGELAIHGIAMRPSSPTGIGRVREAIVVLLPGNPVSCLCAYDFFAGRAIRLLSGLSSAWPYRRSPCTASRKIVSSIGRVDYCRVRRDGDGIVPLAISGASILSSTTRADGFVVVPAESEGVPPGETIDVYWYGDAPASA